MVASLQVTSLPFPSQLLLFLCTAVCLLPAALVIMVLYVIGLGLGDEKDITVRGLEAVRGSTKVVLEHYTSILGVDKAKLVRLFAGISHTHRYFPGHLLLQYP